MRQVNYKIVTWPARGSFKISRSSLTEFVTVQLYIKQDNHVGRAECRPYARYNETADSVIAQIRTVISALESGIDQTELQDLMPAGAARNVVDCALWDLQAKISQKPIWKILGIATPSARETAYTLSIDSPKAMAEAALQVPEHRFLKIKIGNEGGLKACASVIAARPDARLIVDANEAMGPSALSNFRDLKNIALIEQPFNSAVDKPDLFGTGQGPLICADESLHTSADLERLWEAGYRAINVKLDKTGGLSEALKLMTTAKDMRFKIMAGCMVGSSLAMAPMAVLESFADYIDLDGPLLLSDDFFPPLIYKGGKIFPPSKNLWG